MKKIILLFIAFIFISSPFLAYAAEGTGMEGGDLPPEAVADSPSDCESRDIYYKGEAKPVWTTPVNCLFLEEPIGGRAGYDLYVISCVALKDETECTYSLWGGGYVSPDYHGPVQAILAWETDKPYQGPFGLLYNYLGLVYAYMSGLIVGIAVLFVVIGGIQMSTSGGDTAKFDAGKSRITKAIVGIILWFTASLILYTINPTFFAF